MSAPPNASNPIAPEPGWLVRICTCQNLGQILRELVTTVISLLIVGLALFLLWDVYCGAKTTANTLDRQKEILSLALGLLGTVTGYYFGRVPAERHADTARDAARRAHEREQKLRQQVYEGLVALHIDFDRLGPAVRLAPAGVSDQ
jgi:hypothetical protein